MRYVLSNLGFQPLPEFIPKQDTWGEFLGYRGPNGILEDVLERAQTLISMVQISDSEYEPVTCGMPYNFVVLNSPVTDDLGKRIINPNC